MKIKVFFAFVVAIATLASCTDDNDSPNSQQGNYDVAYVSIKVNTPSKKDETRSSSKEEATTEETMIKQLYAIAFDKSDNIICYDDDPAAQLLTGINEDGQVIQKSNAFRVSSGAAGLLLIANPGTELSKVLNNATEGMSFNQINTAIKGIDVSEIKNTANGFTMVNAGDEDMAGSEADPKSNAELCLVDLTNKMSIVGKGEGQYETEEAAKAAAIEDEKRVPVKIERLTVKIKVGVSTNIVDDTPGKNVLPEDKAIFKFSGWVLDATNGTFYPWAKKVRLASSPGVTGFYKYNFYTIDPNYDDNIGIKYNPVENYAPVPFKLKDATDYCVENTMKATGQLFERATRVVIQGTYYPEIGWKDNDWFSFANTNYPNLAALQLEYGKDINVNLKDACDRFYAAIKKYADSNRISIGADFANLKQEELNDIPNGGQVVKEDKCIRWYQKGLCYYWYEIRHDDSIQGIMEFAKYGVVRNNYYVLTLNTVDGAGTPWYPEINNPGPGDPDPKDPIDETEGFISVSVTIMDWVKWEHNMDV